MRLLAVVPGAVLAAAMFLAPGATEARADSTTGCVPAPVVVTQGDALSAQPGTDAEARDYARREAESPEAQDFVGGDVGFFGVIILAGIVLVLLILLLEEKKA